MAIGDISLSSSARSNLTALTSTRLYLLKRRIIVHGQGRQYWADNATAYLLRKASELCNPRLNNVKITSRPRWNR